MIHNHKRVCGRLNALFLYYSGLNCGNSTACIFSILQTFVLWGFSQNVQSVTMETQWDSCTSSLECSVSTETGLSLEEVRSCSVAVGSAPSFSLHFSAPGPTSSVSPLIKGAQLPFDWTTGAVGVFSLGLSCSAGVLIGPDGSGRTPSATASCCKWRKGRQRHVNQMPLCLKTTTPTTPLTRCNSVMVLSPSTCFFVSDSSWSRTDCFGCMPLS